MLVRILFLSFLALSLGGCTGSRNFQSIEDTNPAIRGAPRFIELRVATRIATLHFPRGLYALNATDDAGFYFRAPQKIVEHSYAGAPEHEGGLYLSKKGRGRLRGYIYWHGGLTHVGSFSRTDYTLHD